MKNEHLAKAALEKQKNILDLEVRLDGAKQDYSEAVRDMHKHGMSYREIAVRLGVSHQRIHQLVDQGRKKERSWIRLVDYNLKCSFCGLSNQEVSKLVAGSKIFICDVCADNCSAVVQTKKSIKTKNAHFKPLEEAAALSCSFCAKPSRSKTAVVGTSDQQICEACLQSIQHCLHDK
ncbi:MAG: hypothetical protein K2X29_07130 [Candidatus Obscuribacterales bacterium]|jgi:transposase-like protein|nr:hypothetical protein [Candidatus Obscuribacterales bacterium]